MLKGVWLSEEQIDLLIAEVRWLTRRWTDQKGVSAEFLALLRDTEKALSDPPGLQGAKGPGNG